MRPLSEAERALLHFLADAGKPTELSGPHAIVGKTLEQMGLVFFVRNSALAVITPKGRHLIAEPDSPFKPISNKQPLGFLV
jgi:hypothetical protein